MVGPERLSGKKKRFALIGVAVGVVVAVAWLVWPDRSPKNLKLRLKFLRTEVVDGKTKVLFEVQGAERYEFHVVAFVYFHRNDGFSVNYVAKGRIVYTEPPQHQIIRRRRLLIAPSSRGFAE
jgi:hypothetical protein